MEEQKQQQHHQQDDDDNGDNDDLHPIVDYGCEVDTGGMEDLFPEIMEALSGSIEVFASTMTMTTTQQQKQRGQQPLERPSTTSDTSCCRSSQDGTAEGKTDNEAINRYLRKPDIGLNNRGRVVVGKHHHVTSRRNGDGVISLPASLFTRIRTNGSGSVDDIGSERSTHKIVITRPYQVKEHYAEAMFYVSTSAILGSVFRTYMARFFGQDCEVNVVNDFWTSLSANICVTNGGRTLQTGGALFYDFPANVVGSFIMGLISPGPDTHRARIPWLHREHPLQRDDVYLESLGIGFCGSLTTFSSWNTQMVVMLDGTYCELGPQVVPALFGYGIGLMGAYCAFQFGRQTGLWMYNIKHSGEGELAQLSWEDEMERAAHYAETRIAAAQQGVELVDDVEVDARKPVPNHLHKIPLFLAATGLLVGFVIAGFKNDISYYKGMTLLWFASPVGSLLRWRLSMLNSGTGKGFFPNRLPTWVPWGTLCANVGAAMIGDIMTGLDDRFFSSSSEVGPSSEITFKDEWIVALLFAINSGLAGSLSTVSTMIKEAVDLMERHVGEAKAHYYVCGTCLFSMLLGLSLYAATVRINT